MEASLNENTYAALKQDIMGLRLKPGDAISAAKVAEMYRVSRTPAREAIVKLEREGLLRIFPQSKTLVSKIDLGRAMQEWFVRSTLEVEMVPLFLSHCDELVLRRLSENLEKQKSADIDDPYNYFRLDNAFHGIIYESSGELLAKEIIDTNMTHYNRIRYLSDLSRPVHEKTLAEHGQIIEAARERDAEWMQAIVKKHIRRIHSDRNEVLRRYPEYFSV